MTRNAVLLLTHRADYFTIDRVAEAVRSRGARAVRLDTDAFPGTVRLAARLGAGAGTGSHRIVTDTESITTDEVRAVWARRVWEPELADDLDPRYREACARESKAALRAFLDDLHDARWVNSPGADHAALDKGAQLRVAESAGLRVPKTLITNDPGRAREFYDEVEGHLVAKLLTAFTVSMGPAPVSVPTSPVTADDLEHAALLRHGPMVFQERIEKAVELRVAWVAGQPFVGAIDASSSVGGRTDWRGATPAEVSWERADLPTEVASRLEALMKRLDLVYGAIDLIRQPDGEHVFLEVNPGGEWGMLERDLELPISAALADALLADESEPS